MRSYSSRIYAVSGLGVRSLYWPVHDRGVVRKSKRVNKGPDRDKTDNAIRFIVWVERWHRNLPWAIWLDESRRQ